MIFQKTGQKVERGTKTQTRREPKTGETYSVRIGNKTNYPIFPESSIEAVYTATGRVKWRLGYPIAMLPARGKKAVGYILIKSISLQILSEITENDAIEEGIIREQIGMNEAGEQITVYGYEAGQNFLSAVGAYKALWDSINGKWAWHTGQLVWVLGFKYLGETKP